MKIYVLRVTKTKVNNNGNLEIHTRPLRFSVDGEELNSEFEQIIEKELTERGLLESESSEEWSEGGGSIAPSSQRTAKL